MGDLGEDLGGFKALWGVWVVSGGCTGAQRDTWALEEGGIWTPGRRFRMSPRCGGSPVHP